MNVRGEDRTCMVTGATGYLGSRLVRRLTSRGWRVHAITRAASSLHRLAGMAGETLTIHRLSNDWDMLYTLLEKERPQVVFHLASTFVAVHKREDVAPLIESNIAFASVLTDAMVAAGVHHLVNTGTSWESTGPGDDGAPVNLYAATKSAFSRMLDYYISSARFSAISLRLFDTYGPGDDRRKIVPLLLGALKSGERLSLSPGEQLLDLVYADDVASAYLTAADRLIGGRVQGHERYSVRSGDMHSLKAVVQMMERLSGVRLNCGWGERPYRDREVMVPWSADPELPGWTPGTSLAEGMAEVLRGV